MKIDAYSAPALVTWQLTRDCNLACLHCCTDSAPGRALPGELSRAEALEFSRQLAEAGVPYVMLAGGEPTIVPHFWDVAEALGRAGVFLKIETNGQNFGDEEALRLSRLPVRSVQVSLDGATRDVYAAMRPGGSLDKALAACRALKERGLPLEITFAPTRLNLHEAETVVNLAFRLGAFRFNTGRLMPLGTAAKLWDRLVPEEAAYEEFHRMLLKRELALAGRMELCFRPFSIEEEPARQSAEPPATLLVLPDGRVKVSATLPFICADLKRQSLSEAWDAYRKAWKSPEVLSALAEASQDRRRLSEANRWRNLTEASGNGKKLETEGASTLTDEALQEIPS